MRTDRSRIALAFCSTFAIAVGLVVGASDARAQSFEGAGTFASGSGSISVGSGTTTIDITSSDAVINWAVTPALDTTNPNVPIIFQPAGTTATFQSTADFSVLNRILPTDQSRPIQFNGTVISQLQLQSNVPGGTVYFYTPGGIIIGSSAVFNVGNLGLTSIDPAVVGGVFEQGAPGAEFVQFNGAVRPGSAVTIQPGAQITGSDPVTGSYLAIVAPVINQGGSIDGKRVSALVSADAATMTFRTDGLFDIQVTSGTSGTGTTLTNTGSITGPAGDPGNASRIYMVAVPKNDAISMVIANGSTLGFDIADAADVQGNAIILSAGQDIGFGNVTQAPSSGGGTGQAAITIAGNVDITSSLTASATANTFVFANAGETINFASDVDISGTQASADPNFNAVQLRATGNGGQINIAGNVNVVALDPKNLAPSSGYTVSNFAAIDADNGGSITIGGNALVTNDQNSSLDGVAVTTGSARIAASTGGSISIGQNALISATSFTSGNGRATGGNASVSANGGSISVGGVTRSLAYGIAGLDNGSSGAGGTGTGGYTEVFVEAGGTFTTNELNVAADGVGGADSETGSGAGAAFGGTAVLRASGPGSTFTVNLGNSTGNQNTGDLDFLSAEAFGGWTSGGGNATGGAATGGTARIDVLNGAIFNGPSTGGSFGLIRIIARASGGMVNDANTTGGQATGGSIFITVDNATMTSADLLPSSFAQGGGVPFASEPPIGVVNGGNAFGGVRNITVRNGGTLTASVPGGGPGAVGGTGTDTGRGGDASGGSASVIVDNATFNVTDRLAIFSQNQGGDGGIGGNAISGNAVLAIDNGGTVNVSSQGATQEVLVAANAFGGGSANNPGTTGGNATGGTAQLFVNNSTLNAANVNVIAQGQGGTGFVTQGGNGTGGTARLQLRGGAINGVSLSVDASGFGATPDMTMNGNGGNGLGGFATLEATSGTTTLDFTGIEVRADGIGGDALGTSGNAGNGQGGAAQIFATNGATLTATVSEGFIVNVDSLGGFAAVTGNGGNAIAGSARVIVNNGTMTLDGDLEIDGNASGGDGVNGGSAVGNPINPNAQNAFISVSNGSLTVTGFTALDGDISGGDGRDGGNGGNAGSGFAQIFASDNNGTGLRGSISLQDVLIESSSNGGSAFGTGNGGTAASGRAHVFVNGGDIDIAGDIELETVATGGDGLNGGDAISLQPFRQPRGLIGSFNGTIDIAGSTLFSSAAFGGNATAIGGGRGGTAFAGQAGIDAQSQNGPSAVTVGSLLIDVGASGGFGGEGASGQAGGAGGDAYGGFAFAQGNAGRGVLTVNGDTVLDASAFGGFGGQGGSGGTTAPGGRGGDGGRAVGGGTGLGTASGVDTVENTGSASFGLVSALVQAFGGDGGDGGLGTMQGNGGNGGIGYGGLGSILVRGSPATFGNATFDASGYGGDGGAGTVAGNGGDGYAGDLSVAVTQRFERTERGSLTANNLIFVADGIGGTGAVDGRSFYSAAFGSERGFFIRQSDVSLNSLSMTTAGDLPPNVVATVLQVQDTTTGVPVPTQVTVAPEPFDINVSQSTVNIASALSVSTPGQMLVTLDTSTVNAGSLSLSAGNFVLPAMRPTTLGTFNLGATPVINTGQDLLAYANFVFPGGWALNINGSLLTGNITSGGFLNLAASGTISTGALDAVNVLLNAGQGLTTLAIDSDDRITIVSGGAISTGNLTTTGSGPAAGKVAIGSSVGPVTTGAITTPGDLGIQTTGAITTGNLAGRDVLLLTGGNLTTGSIAAPTGAIYFGNSSMVTSTTNVFQAFRGPSGPLPIFKTQPTAIGGSVTFGGAIQTGSIFGAATGSLTGLAITASDSIDFDLGGVATVNGAWRAPRKIDILSNDIVIASTGSLDALSTNGEVLLESINSAGVFVGDGASSSQTGYVLDNAEFGRIRSGEIAIVGVDTAQATDMTVGNLTVTGDQLYGADGTLILATGDTATEVPAGILRVSGAISGTGFTPTTSLALLSGTVELEAVQGSIKLADSSGGLGGVVYIEADNIHVASDEILTKLRADPRYVGHIADINTPLTVARPEGVLNAFGLEIYPGNTFYIQNTGTVLTPAGFLTTFDNSEVIAPDSPPTGGVEIVINGQFRTSTGTATGVGAFALVQADPTPDSEQFAGFSSTSQLNSCLFLGSVCANGATDPVASVSSEIALAITSVLADAPSAPEAASADEGEDTSGESESAEEEGEGESASSPIAPPAPLINTRPLNPDANVVEPVSGAGNPALLGSAVNEDDAGGENQ
ncbi:hypothetical protein A6F68_02578 [Tsuneonella dongtanensis]|uniref:Uncharacterized protein n=1 Tax=Tsuneonella dongtanensis TaxID=692370 RepID=A0A1B2AG00_9SPHN|nr:hypothetical protein [Tsuneonella dongtanensis]ANY21072.1 hypothetical protein A6F68_02578 [Tsuneonella dongtanensis]